MGSSEEDDSIAVVVYIMERSVIGLLSGLEQGLFNKEATEIQSGVSIDLGGTENCVADSGVEERESIRTIPVKTQSSLLSRHVQLGDFD